MGTIGDRLRQERDRLGLTQEQLAEIAGTTRKSQFNYETDARTPDAAYLSAIAAKGVDVAFVVTGDRAVTYGAYEHPKRLVNDVPNASYLSPDEAALLDNYRHSDPTGQAALRQTSAALAKPGKVRGKHG